jgi:YggT family protein
VLIVHELITLYIWILIISALLSWFPTTDHNSALAGVKRVLARLTEPILRPLRAIVPRPRVGGMNMDFSVMVAAIVLIIINNII